jgi:hypothetical protein
MDIILTKKQLNLLREDNNKPAADVSNTEGDNDVSSLRHDSEEVAQAQGGNNMDQSINVGTYAGNVPKANANQTMTIPVGNGSIGQAATKAQDVILHTPTNSLPGRIILTQGRKINGKLVEVTTFKKNELDKCLKSL